MIGPGATLGEKEKERIIEDFLPFIKHTARMLGKRLPPQLAVNDLISAGIVGLLDSLQRYEEGRVKLNTFAEYRIRGAMLDELRSQDWLPRSVRDKSNAIKKTRRQLEKDLGRPAEDEEVAMSLGMSLGEYYRTLQAVHSATTLSLEDFDGTDREMDLAQRVADPSARTPFEIFEDNAVKELLARHIECLPEKEKLVLSLYFWEELTMKEIGKVLKLSEGRVCQLRTQALLRLKARLDLDS